MRRRSQPNGPSASLRRDEGGALGPESNVAVPIAPKISVIGEETRLNVERLHRAELFSPDDLIVNRDGALACQTIGPNTVDQRLRSLIAVHMPEDLPIFFTRFGQTRVEEF